MMVPLNCDMLLPRRRGRGVRTVTLAARLLDWVKTAFRQLAHGATAGRVRPDLRAAAAPAAQNPVAAEEFARGCVLREAGSLAEAIGAFTRAIEARHDYVDAIVALGAAYMQCGKDEDAADQFQLALAFD